MAACHPIAEIRTGHRLIAPRLAWPAESIPAYAREHGLPVWRVYDRVAAGTIGSVVVKGHARIPI
jgi:hypothetical protein